MSMLVERLAALVGAVAVAAAMGEAHALPTKPDMSKLLTEASLPQ